MAAEGAGKSAPSGHDHSLLLLKKELTRLPALVLFLPPLWLPCSCATRHPPPAPQRLAGILNNALNAAAVPSGAADLSADQDALDGYGERAVDRG